MAVSLYSAISAKGASLVSTFAQAVAVVEICCFVQTISVDLIDDVVVNKTSTRPCMAQIYPSTAQIFATTG